MTERPDILQAAPDTPRRLALPMATEAIREVLDPETSLRMAREVVLRAYREAMPGADEAALQTAGLLAGLPFSDLLAEIAYAAHIYQESGTFYEPGFEHHLEDLRGGSGAAWGMRSAWCPPLKELVQPSGPVFRELVTRCAELQVQLIARESADERYEIQAPAFSGESGGPIVDLCTGPRGMQYLQALAKHPQRRAIRMVDTSPFVARLLQAECGRLGLESAPIGIEVRDASDPSVIPVKRGCVQMWNAAAYFSPRDAWMKALRENLTERGSRVVVGVMAVQEVLETCWPRTPALDPCTEEFSTMHGGLLWCNEANTLLLERFVDELQPGRGGWGLEIGSIAEDGSFRAGERPAFHPSGRPAHAAFVFTRQA